MRPKLLAVAAALFILPNAAHAWPTCGTVDTFPGETWEEIPFYDVDDYGWDWTDLHVARRMFQGMDSGAVMVVHRGRLIAAWGDTGERYVTQSVRKSLLNSLVGQAEARGDLNLDTTLAELGIDDSDPSLTLEERGATVEHLLLSRAGIMHRAAYESPHHQDTRDRFAAIKAEDPTFFRPGEMWTYNNWDCNAMGAAMEISTGERLGPLFERDVAAPIGMEDYRARDVYYIHQGDLSERALGNNSDIPAYMFDMSTRDLARYGLLYLNCGNWDGQQLVPADWINRSLAAARPVNEGLPEEHHFERRGDYGYHWWVDQDGRQMYWTLDMAEPFYFGTGGRGHEVFIFPSLDLVITHQVPVRSTGLFAQLSRRFFGGPSTPEYEVGLMVRTIIQGHPDAATAFAEPE
jgi:CubicO group peptidase (beta-lactamase class C family)